MAVLKWQTWAVSHLNIPTPCPFAQEFLDWLGPEDKDDLGRWVGLLLNIWNATRQPNRYVRSAVQKTANLGSSRSL